MVRLIAPNGVTVSVSDEKGDRLVAQGFRSLDGQSVKPARRTRRTAPKHEPDDE